MQLHELTGMDRALSVLTIDLSKPAPYLRQCDSDKPKLQIPIGTEFGEWVTITEAYYNFIEGESQRSAKVMVRCSCGSVYEKLVSYMKRMSSTRCIDCKRAEEREKREQNRVYGRKLHASN